MGKTTRVGKSLIAVQEELGTEEQCLAFLEALRWPEGVRCVKCQGDKVSKFTVKESTRQRTNKAGEVATKVVPARHLYQCLNPECGHQFTATAGTIFNDTHLPLQKWMLAVAIVCNARKGVSAKQLQRDLGVSYKTAWYLLHRIREAMTLGNWTDEKLAGVVEADETYVGAKRYDKRLKRQRYDKDIVMGMRERGGDVRAWHIQKEGKFASITGKIEENVNVRAELVVTDESRLYSRLSQKGYKHEAIMHSIGKHVEGRVYTNSIENFGVCSRGT